MPEGWQDFVDYHNKLADFAARLMWAAGEAGVPFAVEQPADRGDDQSIAYWEAQADHGCAWQLEEWRAVLARFQARSFTFAACAFGAPWQKWTTVAATGALAEALQGLDRYRCTHRTHAAYAYGTDEMGLSLSERAAEYAPALAAFLADALATAAEATQHPTTGVCGTTNPPRSGDPEADHAADEQGAEEGRIGDGPALGPLARAACEVARSSRPSFASMRNLLHDTPARLRGRALPGDLHAPMRPRAPRQPTAAKRRRLPGRRRSVGCSADDARPRYRPVEEAWALARSRGAPDGPIHIRQLYLPGVYDSEVASWFELADLAAADLRAGRPPRAVPTRVIGQEQMPEWARDIVWDCRSPTDCRPVRPSDRSTAFPGGRQLRRDRVRAVAAAIGWHDQDIIDQVGEGGVEIRSDCEMATVLVFHHASLVQELDAATSTVNAHLEEGWVAPPTRTLPFVPCRLQPRGIIMQARTRLAPDGSIEEYMKPRVTTDGSFGGPDSMNAGVGGHERAVELASVQSLGVGWAVCQSAADGDDAPEELATDGYCVDAESAYSFCPIQEADLWLQGFVWWDAHGRCGVAIDRRMGFGGSFAPNRYQRVSLFVAAYAQHLQAAFDAERPPHAAVARWSADRRARQERGELPGGDAQLAPRYLQAYIDDLTGAGLNDRVRAPAWLLDPGCVDTPLGPEAQKLAPFSFSDAATTASGGTPSPADARVRVHAMIVVASMADLGLHAAPHKIFCGSPLLALGMRIDRSRRCIDCPEGKRAIMLADITEQRDALLAGQGVQRKKATRLTGRLGNLAQAAPELRPRLHGGYGVCRSPGGHTRITPTVGGAAYRAWLELLDVGYVLLDENQGASWAPQETFPSRELFGSVTVVTDASGEDGVGGYAFAAQLPGVVFLVSEEWPVDVRAALAASADEHQATLRRAGDASALPSLSMPAAETFGQWAVAHSVARHARVERVFAVGDCAPAGSGINSRVSPNPQMRAILDGLSGVAEQWLGVSVRRWANVDADRLSHPQMADGVEAEALAAGLRVVRVRWDHDGPEWQRLRAAVAAGHGRHPPDQPDRPRRRRKR